VLHRHQLRFLDSPQAALIAIFKSALGHSNVFICFASFENPKTYQPEREKNKQEKNNKIRADIFE
jgi:NAD/NADP transhydrogenase beta subunit